MGATIRNRQLGAGLAAAGLAVFLHGCGEGVTGQAQASDIPEGARRAPVEKKAAMCILGVDYKDPCIFDPHGRGSFSLRRENGKPFYEDVMEVTVFVFAEGQADIRTTSRDGVSTRLGEATRSEEYPACWLGDGFSVCAY